MFPNPATAEPAPKASNGQDGHKRSPSAESGAATDSTLVAIDDGAVDVGQRAHKRAASVADLRADTAKRGRITTETAPGAPESNPTTTKNDAGSPGAAAPITVSTVTATALAVADLNPNANACNEPDEAPDNGELGVATARDPAGPASYEETAAAASSAESDDVIAPRSPASTSGVESVDGSGVVLVSPSDDPAAVASDTNAHGHDSQPDTIIANPGSHVHPGCPDTPVVARLPVPRSHVVAGTAIPTIPAAASSGPIRAFSTGRERGGTSYAAPAVPPSPGFPPASATAGRYLPMRLPQHPPEVIAALCLLSAAVSHGEPDPDPAVEEDIQAGFRSIKKTMNALFTGEAVPTNGHRSTSPGPPEEDDSKNVYEGAEREAELAALEKYKDQERDDGWWDDDAPVDPALLELLKPERRRHFF